MPPRYAYWTILAGGLPTAFRAAERADLLPTFNRIRERQPDAEMKWFARGRLWESPEAAQDDLLRARTRPRRARDWRPGGDHRDPKQQFKKRARGDRDERHKESRPRRTRTTSRAAAPHAARPPRKRQR